MTAANPAPSTAASAPRALVFGGSGQIGERLLTRLLSGRWQVTAWSRQPRAARSGLIWRQGDLAVPAAAGEAFEVIFSCGPLDHFARWYAENPMVAPRIVAFGSTSVEVKDYSIPAPTEPARRDFGYAPRAFRPLPEELGIGA